VSSCSCADAIALTGYVLLRLLSIGGKRGEEKKKKKKKERREKKRSDYRIVGSCR